MYTIIETPLFTALAEKLISQEEHDNLTQTLVKDTEAGEIIPGGGGIRKIRMGLKGRGKSGGARVIYFFIDTKNQIHLIYIYPKNKQENITDKEKALFKSLAKELAK
jgi:hypothetical protein